jgi:hypothetical protein
MTVRNPLPEIEAGIVRGMNLAAERLLTLSTAVAPLDQGTLIASAQVEPAQSIDDGAAVVYDTPYAARLHEHPEYQFQGGRQGKYLEEPAVQNRKELGEIIREEAQSG